MGSNFVMSGFGFFFWALCARLYSAEKIGLATALISLTSFITAFSLFGLNTSVIRFLPSSKNKNDLINTVFILISIITIIISIIVLISLPLISPKLIFLHDYPLFEVFFILFMIVSSLNSITDSMFIANRKSEYILIVDTIMSGVKLITPFFLVSLGTYGIFYGYATSINIAFILSIFFIVSQFNYSFTPKINKELVIELWRFSFGNYLANVIGMISTTITPILIINILGSATAAYYYMPSMIIVFVQTISRSMSYSMIAEGAHTEQKLKPLFIRSLIGTYFITIPLAAIIAIAGPTILSIFGKSYSNEGLSFLQLTLISLIISIPNTFSYTVLTIKKKVKKIILISALNSLISLILTLLLLQKGLNGLGIANVLLQVVMFFVYLLMDTFNF